MCRRDVTFFFKIKCALRYFRRIKKIGLTMRLIKPSLVLSLLFLFTGFSLSAQQNYYSVKFPDDRTIVSCGGTADTIWPEITYYTNCNFNVGISVKDQVFNLNNTGTCKKIIRTWKLIWWCDYNPNWPSPTFILNPEGSDVGPTVFGNSQNHGYLQYAQVIKIVDNVAPVFLNCPAAPVLFCDYTNNDPAQYGARCEGPVDLKVKVTDACSKADLIISYRLYLDLDGNGSMETFRSSSAPGAWPIVKTITNDTVMAQIELPTGVGLPYGKHKVEWIANDRCGNESLCKYDFEVKDCKPPTVVCINGLSINIMQTGMITLWDTDFLQYTSDNCTPASQIKIAIRKAGTGTGFPLDQHSVTFDCNEVGQQFVEIWAQDASGNADYCQTYVIVQDNIGACSPSGPVTGNVSTDQNQSLAGVKILLKSNLPAIQNQSLGATDAAGNYAFANAPGTCNYSITPHLDTLPQAGVSTLDVLLTEMHISGQTPLPNPYRIIAADVNKDALLNQADLDAMSNLILGQTTGFPGNTAWRFVPKSHVFAQPALPLASAFPEKISTVCPHPSGLNQHFVAIKTGDVDGSALNSSRSEEKAIFFAEKQRFDANEEITVLIQTPDLGGLKGFQFTLDANPAFLQLQSVEPGSIPVKFIAQTVQNRVTASWYSTAAINGVQTVFIVKFKTLQGGTLSSSLEINSSLTQAEAYDATLQVMGATLEFQQSEARSNFVKTGEQAQLFPVSPNPTSGPVAAAFYLPADGEATLSLYNLSGQLIATQSGFFQAGTHRIEMPVNASGVMFLHLQSSQGTGVQRIVVK